MGMGKGYNQIISSIVLGGMVVWSTLCYSQEFVCSRATFYGSPDCLGNPLGACGYGEYGTTVNNGNVAAVSRLYKGGTGCGGCYQVRCKSPGGLCTDDGVTVVATDHGGGDNTDFILSPKAYTGMARPGLEPDLLSYGVVDVEFRRVGCPFSASLVIRVHERSNYPHYLAVVPLYQAGMYDIVGVEIWEEDCKEWRPMRKPFGAVWDMENPPRGPLTLRVELANAANSADCKWVELPSAIPDSWKGASLFDTGVHLA